MFAVSPVSLGKMALSARVPEHIDETEVITSREESVVFAFFHEVNVSAVLPRRKDSLDSPAKLNAVSRPLDPCCVRCTPCVLGDLVSDGEEEKLVGAAAASND